SNLLFYPLTLANPNDVTQYHGIVQTIQPTKRRFEHHPRDSTYARSSLFLAHRHDPHGLVIRALAQDFSDIIDARQLIAEHQPIAGPKRRQRCKLDSSIDVRQQDQVVRPRSRDSQLRRWFITTRRVQTAERAWPS